LIFELSLDNNSNNNSSSMVRDASDYSIRYHQWTLRQLYRHVVTSIKVRSAASTDPTTTTSNSTSIPKSLVTNSNSGDSNNNTNGDESIRADAPRHTHAHTTSEITGHRRSTSTSTAIYSLSEQSATENQHNNNNNNNNDNNRHAAASTSSSHHRRHHSTTTLPRPIHRRQNSTDHSASSHYYNYNYNHQYHYQQHQQQYGQHHPLPPPALLPPKLLGSNLHPRDMRRLVTPFSASNEPELIVRRHVMVFNFDPFRAIITRDRLLVMVPPGADSLLKKLEERIVGNSFEYEDYDDDDEEIDNVDEREGGKDAGVEESAEKTTRTAEESSNAFESDRETNDGDGNNDHNNDNDVETGFFDEEEGGGGTEDETNTITNTNTDDENNDNNIDGDGDHRDEITTSSDDDWSDMMRMEMDQQKDLTFELLCVNACLSTVFEMLATDTEELQEKGLKYVQNRIIGNTSNSSKQKQLRPEDSLAVIRNLKISVLVMQARVKGFVQSINRILNEDEDMALMNVSRLVTNPENFVQPVSSEMLEIESDEPELVLESNLNNALTLSNALDLIQGQVETASDLIDARMDAARNKFLLASLLMSIASLSLTALTCVSGIFGMNLPSGIEEEQGYFVPVTYGSIVGSLLLGIAIFVGMIRTGVITGLGPVDQEGIDSLF